MKALMPTHDKLADSMKNNHRKIPAVFSGYQLNSAVLDLIWLERLRQQQLLREGKFTFSCATVGIDPDRKLRVCTEELGEIAEAIDKLEIASLASTAKTRPQIKSARAHLRDEIVQLAACAIAWLESIQEEKQ